jgi:hypothetical protein
VLSGNEIDPLTRGGPRTPMGDLMRRYWLARCSRKKFLCRTALRCECVFLAKKPVAFRDSRGRVGLIGEHCSHRGTSLYFGKTKNAASPASIMVGNTMWMVTC